MRPVTLAELEDLRGAHPARMRSLVKLGLVDSRGGWLTPAGNAKVQEMRSENARLRAEKLERLRQIPVRVTARDLFLVLERRIDHAPSDVVDALVAALREATGEMFKVTR